MLKKILSIILSVVMLCSMAVIAGANIETKTEWVENFDGYLASDFYAGSDSTSPIWVFTKNCKEHTAYSSNGEGGHYHLNDGWTMQSRGFQNGSYAAYNAWSLKNGDHGKKNSDKSLYADYLRYQNVNLKNNFGGNAVDLTGGKAVGFSFDWYDSSSQAHASHHNLYREIKMTVTLGKEGAEDISDIELNLGQLKWDRFISAVSTSVTASGYEKWNDFAMVVSKDTVLVQASSEKEPISFSVANYTPADGETAASWSADANSGYYIKSVKSVEVHLRGTGTLTRQNGIDNLKTWIEDTVPSALPAKETPVFANLTAPKKTVTTAGGGQSFKFDDGQMSTRLGVQLAGENATSIIKPSLVIDDNDTVKSANGTESWLKITSDSAGGIGSNLFYVIMFDKNGTKVGEVGDVIQTSCDIKLKGDSAAKSTYSNWDIKGNFSTGSGNIVSIAADGTVFDTGFPSKPITKLESNKWYSVDVVFTLADGITNAKVYIDGAPVLEKNVKGQWEDVGAVRLSYNPELNAEGTGFLANTVYLDNFCYHIFKGGVGAYNFDKSLETANNKVIKAATEDFVNGIIAPVAADWTVGEFNALGVANASVIDIAEDGTETVVTDTTALLKDKTIKITGDYGKDMYYTVSSEGATFVTKDYLVIAKQDGEVLANNGTCAAGASISAVAYDKTGTGNIIFTAEYSGKQLVKVEIGEAYAPTTAGNTIKLYAWTDSEKIVPVVPVTTLTVGE